jgi:hypothetical protein
VRIYYGFVLDALKEAGDLSLNGLRYTLHSNALSTLARYEEENRRHEDAVRLQKILIFLTAALVFVGLLQAFVTYTNA